MKSIIIFCHVIFKIFMEIYYLIRLILFHFISPKWDMVKEGFLERIFDIAYYTKYSMGCIFNIIYWNTKTDKHIQEVEI